MSDRIQRVEGTITLEDGAVVHFALDPGGSRSWGAPPHLLGNTVAARDAMYEALVHEDLFSPGLTVGQERAVMFMFPRHELDTTTVDATLHVVEHPAGDANPSGSPLVWAISNDQLIAVLDAWRHAAPRSRNYRFGGADEDGDEQLFVTWIAGDGSLQVTDTDSVDEDRAYLIADILHAFPNHTVHLTGLDDE